MQVIHKLGRAVARHEVSAAMVDLKPGVVEEATAPGRGVAWIEQEGKIWEDHQTAVEWLMAFNRLDHLSRISIALSIKRVLFEVKRQPAGFNLLSKATSSKSHIKPRTLSLVLQAHRIR